MDDGKADPGHRHHTHDQADTVIVAAGRAHPMYLHDQAAYVCQSGRGFSSGLGYLGFYHGKQIHRALPRILGRFDEVEVTGAEADLRYVQGDLGNQFANVIRWILTQQGRAQAYAVGKPCQIFILSPPGSSQTLTLAAPIRHPEQYAWTHNQRYTHSTLLLQRPQTTI